MRFLIRIMVVFVIVMAAMSALRSLMAPRGAPAKPRAQNVRSGKLVKDPVCGTYVSPEGSLSLKRRSETFYFCSEDCREKFMQSETGTTA